MSLNFEVSTDASVETLVIPLFQRDLDTTLPPLADLLQVDLERLRSDFEGRRDEDLMQYPLHGRTAGKIYLIGLNSVKGPRRFGRVMRRFVEKHKLRLFRDMAIDFTKWTSLKSLPEAELEAYLQACVENCLLGTYEIGKYKRNVPETKGPRLENIILLIDDAHAEMARRAVETADVLVAARTRALDLVNAPSNHLTARKLAEAAQASGEAAGYTVEVLDKAAIVETGLHALLAVNQGSEQPPTFSVLDYHPTDARLTVGLVGKGVTFDTGGVSMKSPENMWHMKSDMGGAAAVIGAVEAAAGLKLPLRVVAAIPATDNKTGGNAINPGDVIDSYHGQTIEVEDTDAEGRLIMADGLAYLNRRFRPDVLINVATLTGASVIALGYQAGALCTPNEALAASLQRAGERAGERVWRLPLWDEYFEQLHSDVADLRNLGGKAAGAITAAKFLEAFTEEHSAWAHLDIAGVAFGDSEFSKRKSATAFGVGLLVTFFRDWLENTP